MPARRRTQNNAIPASWWDGTPGVEDVTLRIATDCGPGDVEIEISGRGYVYLSGREALRVAVEILQKIRYQEEPRP